MYKELEVSFPISDIIQNDIDHILEELNSGKKANLADCYMSELYNELNNSIGYDLTEEQAGILRQYYCRGGIYGKAH